MKIFDIGRFCSLFAKPVNPQFSEFLQILQNESGVIKKGTCYISKKSKLIL